MADFSPPPFDRLGPAHVASPLVLAVPHAGRDYPEALVAGAAVPRATLEELEDRFADLLVEDAVAAGAVAIVARIARACIDLNRGPEDLDPASRGGAGEGAPITARARAGLGLLPRRLGRTELWHAAPAADDAAARIATVHAPFHAAIAAALADAVARHGFAMLLDCHSMPPLRGAGAARIVLGDRHGASAGAGMAGALVALARREGFAAALNAPYAGAYTLQRHAAPRDGVHALQLEIDRSLYLRADLRRTGEGIGRVRRLVARIGAEAVALARPPAAIAAE